MSGRCPRIFLQHSSSPGHLHMLQRARNQQCRRHRADDEEREARQLQVTSRARRLPRGSTVRGRSLPHRSAAADSCRPSHPHLRSLPWPTLPFGATPARRTAKPAINRGRLLNGRVQVAAYHIPGGLQRDCYLPQKKPFF